MYMKIHSLTSLEHNCTKSGGIYLNKKTLIFLKFIILWNHTAHCDSKFICL